MQAPRHGIDKGRRRYRAWIGILRLWGVPVGLLAAATLLLALWPIARTQLQNSDFFFYGLSRAVTKTVDRLRATDPDALVIYYRLFLLYLVTGGVAAVVFLARGLRAAIESGNRSDFAFLVFLQSPVILLFLDDRMMRGGRLSLLILALIHCLIVPVLWWTSSLLLAGAGGSVDKRN